MPIRIYDLSLVKMRVPLHFILELEGLKDQGSLNKQKNYVENLKEVGPQHEPDYSYIFVLFTKGSKCIIYWLAIHWDAPVTPWTPFFEIIYIYTHTHTQIWCCGLHKVLKLNKWFRKLKQFICFYTICVCVCVCVIKYVINDVSCLLEWLLWLAM